MLYADRVDGFFFFGAVSKRLTGFCFIILFEKKIKQSLILADFCLALFTNISCKYIVDLFVDRLLRYSEFI